MNRTYLFALALGSVTIACGSTKDGSASSGIPTRDPAADPCGLNSGFEGDELCILPPAPGEGIQLHAGPASYDDPNVLAPWVIDAGDENVQCYNVRIPESGFYYFAQKNRMRSGSHHMLISLVQDTGQAEGPTNCDILGSVASIPGSQTPSRDFPDNTLGPEDQGLARYLPAGTLARFQLHYVNTTTHPLLREAWVNVYRMDESLVTQRLQSVFLVGDIAENVPAHTEQLVTLDFTPTLSDATRIFQLNAHMHAHSLSMTVWRLRADQRDLVYKSYDWKEPNSLTYNTVVENPPPDDTAKTDGGTSGDLLIQPGDTIEWTCDVNNDTDAALRFANEAYTAEMCLLAGSYVSPTPGLFAGMCMNGTCMQRTQ